MILQIILAPLVELVLCKAFSTIKCARQFPTGEISFYNRICRTFGQLGVFLDNRCVMCLWHFCSAFIVPRKGMTLNLIFKYPLYRILTLQITQFKTRRPLFLPLNRQALRWMPERGDATDEDFIFPPLSKNMTVLDTWAKEAGISKHVTFHVSRHTFATMELTMGADLYTTSKLLGHTEVRTTQIYAKIVNSKKEEAVSLLDSAFE